MVFFPLFVQKHLIPHSYTLWTNILFSCWDVENRTKWVKKKKKSEKRNQKKRNTNCAPSTYALEIFKGHLHMQKINRFWKDNQSIECYTYFCNQRSIFLVLFVFRTGPKKQWACYVRHIRLILNDRCCSCPPFSPAPLMGALWVCIACSSSRGIHMASVIEPLNWRITDWHRWSSM